MSDEKDAEAREAKAAFEAFVTSAAEPGGSDPSGTDPSPEDREEAGMAGHPKGGDTAAPAADDAIADALARIGESLEDMSKRLKKVEERSSGSGGSSLDMLYSLSEAYLKSKEELAGVVEEIGRRHGVIRDALADIGGDPRLLGLPASKADDPDPKEGEVVADVGGDGKTVIRDTDGDDVVKGVPEPMSPAEIVAYVRKEGALPDDTHIDKDTLAKVFKELQGDPGFEAEEPKRPRWMRR
jgi:hypothetical protein